MLSNCCGVAARAAALHSLLADLPAVRGGDLLYVHVYDVDDLDDLFALAWSIARLLKAELISSGNMPNHVWRTFGAIPVKVCAAQCGEDG